MFEFLLLVKFVISIVVVLGLSIIAERVNPSVAGFLVGLPTGTAISLFFFGIDHGPLFAAKSAVFNLAGMVALLVFIIMYYLVSQRTTRFSIILSSLAALIGYGISIIVLNHLHFDLLFSVFLLIISILFSIYFFRSIKTTKIKEKIPFTNSVLIVRSVIASIIVLVVIGVAGTVGPEWAGLFSAFPTTSFPLLLIIHYTYGKNNALTIIKNLPTGLAGLLLYSVSVFYTYPTIGIYFGTMVSYLVVVAYVFVVLMYKKI